MQRVRVLPDHYGLITRPLPFLRRRHSVCSVIGDPRHLYSVPLLQIEHIILYDGVVDDLVAAADALSGGLQFAVVHFLLLHLLLDAPLREEGHDFTQNGPILLCHHRHRAVVRCDGQVYPEPHRASGPVNMTHSAFLQGVYRHVGLCTDAGINDVAVLGNKILPFAGKGDGRCALLLQILHDLWDLQSQGVPVL